MSSPFLSLVTHLQAALSDGVQTLPFSRPRQFLRTELIHSRGHSSRKNSYDQILSTFKRIVPLPSILHEEDSYHLSPAKLETQINELGITALMLSNPHNPTGQVIHGEELKKLVEISRKKEMTVILDEVSLFISSSGLI